jgi:hypothetical protein
MVLDFKPDHFPGMLLLWNQVGARTTTVLDRTKPLKYKDLGRKLPEVPPTQVISIRLPSALLNNLRATRSETDVPHQALIKLFLSDSVAKSKKVRGVNPAAWPARVALRSDSQ